MTLPIMKGFILLLVILSAIWSCSFQYVDEHGARHIMGLSHTVIKETRKDRSEVIAQQVSSVGIAVLAVPEHSGLSLGYTRNFSIHISSEEEGGQISFSFKNPTDVVYKDLTTLFGGDK